MSDAVGIVGGSVGFSRFGTVNLIGVFDKETEQNDKGNLKDDQHRNVAPVE